MTSRKNKQIDELLISLDRERARVASYRAERLKLRAKIHNQRNAITRLESDNAGYRELERQRDVEEDYGEDPNKLLLVPKDSDTYVHGYHDGYAAGYPIGYSNGLDTGHNSGYDAGYVNATAESKGQK